jgi:hypothetical protein
MEAVNSSETSVSIYQTIRCNISEDGHLQILIQFADILKLVMKAGHWLPPRCCFPLSVVLTWRPFRGATKTPFSTESWNVVCYWLKLVQWGRILLEKLIVAQLVKKLSDFYGNCDLITIFIRSPSLVPVLIQINLVHTLTIYYSKIPFNIILPSTLLSPKGSLPSRFADYSFILISYLYHVWYMHRISQPWFGHPNNFWWRVQIMTFLISSFLQSSVISLPSGPNILHTTLFSNTLKVCSSLRVRGRVLHSYNIAGNIVVLYIFNLYVFRYCTLLDISKVEYYILPIVLCECETLSLILREGHRLRIF